MYSDALTLRARDNADGRPSPPTKAGGQRAIRGGPGRRARRVPTSSLAFQSGDVLRKALEESAPEVGRHSTEVGRLVQVTAERLGLGRSQQLEVRLAAELHDVGKIAIPDSILNKPGRLTRDERAAVERHSVIGERILAVAPALADVARLVRSSHEWMDGRGYPDRLAGDDIPLGSRLVAVCDAYDAMVSDRPYQSTVGVEAALVELRLCCGSQFDADIVEPFCDVILENQEAAQGAL